MTIDPIRFVQHQIRYCLIQYDYFSITQIKNLQYEKDKMIFLVCGPFGFDGLTQQ